MFLLLTYEVKYRFSFVNIYYSALKEIPSRNSSMRLVAVHTTSPLSKISIRLLLNPSKVLKTNLSPFKGL
jgi:hypothetical protein